MKKRPDPGYRSFARTTYGFDEPDRQGPHLFCAEDELEDRRYRGLTELCRWIDRKDILDSEWWIRGHQKWRSGWKMPLEHLELYVYGKSRYGTDAEAGFDPTTGHVSLWLPRWAWRENIVLHELSHLVVTPRVRQSHGATYATARLEAQHLFGLPGSGEQLEQEFKSYGVEVRR